MKNVSLLCIVVLCVLGSTVSASWWNQNTGTSSDWYTASNWGTPAAVPGPTDAVTWNWALVGYSSAYHPIVINGGTAASSEASAYADTANYTIKFTVTNAATYNVGSGGISMFAGANNTKVWMVIDGGSTVNVSGQVRVGRADYVAAQAQFDVSGAGTVLNSNSYLWIANDFRPCPTVMNVTDGAVVNNTMWHGLRFNQGGTNDGTINLAGGLLKLAGTVEGGVNLPEDRIDGWIANGWLKGYGMTGSAHVQYSYDSVANVTTIWGVVPEPATIALLGLGAMALLRRNKK